MGKTENWGNIGGDIILIIKRGQTRYLIFNGVLSEISAGLDLP